MSAGATIIFKIDKDMLAETPLDSLLFLWYNEENEEFVEPETTLDESNGRRVMWRRISANNQLNSDCYSDTDHDGVPMPNGKLIFLDPNDRDTDKDGLSDGDEAGKMYKETLIFYFNAYSGYVF